MQQPYLIYRRSKVYYYRLRGEKTFHSTGKTTKAAANEFVLAILNGENPNGGSDATLRDITKTLFIPGECNWLKRKEKKGKVCNYSPQPISLKRSQEELMSSGFRKSGTRG